MGYDEDEKEVLNIKFSVEKNEENNNYNTTPFNNDNNEISNSK